MTWVFEFSNTRVLACMSCTDTLKRLHEFVFISFLWYIFPCNTVHILFSTIKIEVIKLMMMTAGDFIVAIDNVRSGTKADVYCCENELWNWRLKTCAELLKKKIWSSWKNLTSTIHHAPIEPFSLLQFQPKTQNWYEVDSMLSI